MGVYKSTTYRHPKPILPYVRSPANTLPFFRRRVLTSSICHVRSDFTTFSAASCSKVAQCAAELVRVEVAAALEAAREQAEGRLRPYESHIFSCDVVGSETLEAGTFLR